MQIYEEITPQEHRVQVEAEMMHRAQKREKPPWIMVQAVACLLILLTVIAIKYLVPDFYEELEALYRTEMARSILIEYDELSVL